MNEDPHLTCSCQLVHCEDPLGAYINLPVRLIMTADHETGSRSATALQPAAYLAASTGQMHAADILATCPRLGEGDSRMAGPDRRAATDV